MRSRFFSVYQVFITIDQRCGTLESCVSRWGSPSHDEPWALQVPWLLLVMAMRTMISSSVPGTHQALFQTLSWNPNCTENKYYCELHLKSGEWELIISGIKLKVAYFSQGHCHQRKSRSRHLSFLAMVSGLVPSPRPWNFYLPLQTQERAAKVPRAAGERLLGCNSTKR